MRSVMMLLLAMTVGAGCKSTTVNDGYALDLTLTLDSSLTEDQVARLATLDLEVSGAETFANPSLSVAGKFDLRTRSAGLRYKPRATSGTIAIRALISDAEGVVLAVGELDDVRLHSGTQLLSLILSSPTQTGSDGGSDGGIDMGPACGNGTVDPGEACDPGSGSSKPCPITASDCDDHNSCTTDAISGSGCQASCTHTAVADSTGCMMATTSGVCVAGACCTGCVKNGACLAGSTDSKACGALGNACFDCTQNSATATCNAGNCSGCDATSCTTEGRTCGTSSCGFNCGGCPDGCNAGAITHYACVNKSCQMNGSGNCGLYAACASSTTCATTCLGDNGCVATAWCGSSQCKSKVALGQACSAESTGDHECASPNVCSWGYDGTSGFCTSARCTGCAAATASGTCGIGMKYGIDPRGFCPYKDQCNQAFCVGNGCDYGFDVNGLPRACGAGFTSCTNDANGLGHVTGHACANYSTFMTGTCTAVTSQFCTDETQRYCSPCANSTTCGAPLSIFCG